MIQYINDIVSRYGKIVGNFSVLSGYHKIMALCWINQKPCQMKVITFLYLLFGLFRSIQVERSSESCSLYLLSIPSSELTLDIVYGKSILKDVLGR